MGTLIKQLKLSKNTKDLTKKVVIKLLEEFPIKELEHLTLDKVINELKEEKVITIHNTVNKESNAYKYYFNEEDKLEFDSIKVAQALLTLFTGKIGCSKSNGRVDMYDLVAKKSEVIAAIEDFHKLYEDYTIEEIIGATSMFFNMREKTDGAYLYAPKITTYIKGSDKKSYLPSYIEMYRLTNKSTTQTGIHRDGVYRDV